MNPRTFTRVFLIVLVVASIATLFFGWWVIAGVRRTAAETDLRIRTIAWAALAYSSQNEGSFPMSEEELKAFGTGPASITLQDEANAAAWPTERSAALVGHEPADLDAAFRSIVVVWGTDRSMPPYLKSDGLPTRVGTGTEVNGWLSAMRAYLARSASR